MDLADREAGPHEDETYVRSLKADDVILRENEEETLLFPG